MNKKVVGIIISSIVAIIIILLIVYVGPNISKPTSENLLEQRTSILVDLQKQQLVVQKLVDRMNKLNNEWKKNGGVVLQDGNWAYAPTTPQLAGPQTPAKGE
jgi:hypothetical protein